MKKNLILALMILGGSMAAQPEKGISIDIGINRHLANSPDLTYTASLKSNQLGGYFNFVGIDKDRSVKNTAMGSPGDHVISSRESEPYGFGGGLNWSFLKIGLTLSAGANFLMSKTITRYYDSKLSASQNNATPSYFYTWHSKWSPQIFADYNFFHKKPHFIMGIRAAIDWHSLAFAGAFVGYKFTHS